ncbi:unnamed protein product [Caenorhabditis bovis]|uniref:MI domain-containing protein n=1 Tax=Caenorhabditis bovis TaxID=2654633 RepID=A0A8S1F136_9PELO|nr:unnamed protein product [Caenorhabditis bovis]
MSGVSRREKRKNAKQLKKIQAKAFAQRKPVEIAMREAMGLTKADKQKNKRKRKREEKRDARRLEKLQKKAEESEEDVDSDDYEPQTSNKRKKIVEVSVHKGKRKFGYESEDSDDDLTYEQYLKEVEETRRKRLMDPEGMEEDEKAIRKYGVLLGLNENLKDRDGATKTTRAMKGDGLDMLLDFCDLEKRKILMENEANGANSDDDDVGEFEDEEMEEEEEDQEAIDLSEGEEDVDDEKLVDEMVCDEDFDEESDEKKDDEELEEAEDIYGRKINKATGELIKFDPAAARRKLEELDEKTGNTEQKAKIDRAVTGIINRLSDATLVKSQQAIGDLWANYSKNDVKSALCKVLTRVLSSSFRVQDSLLTTYGAFMAMCHSMVSNEISAHFVEVFLCDMVKSAENAEENADDKSVENRVIFVAMLVAFRIIQPSVLLELVDKYAKNLNLSNLQAINLLISYAYKSLRKTSWAVCTEKLERVAEEFEKKPISSLPRAKFLLEQVESLKKQFPKNIDYSMIEQQAKILHGLSKKKGMSAESKELGMTLNDLLHAEERGRWWIVGSAFRLPENGGYGVLAAANPKKAAGNYPSHIVELASRAGMNSEVRRNIFCAIATADDEDEAFEKLLKLSLKGEKEREIVYVLIIMMLKEKTFNLFYAALLQRFCEFHRRFVITLQYAIWDRLRECESLKPSQRATLAKLLEHLLANEVLPISVLKSIEWATRGRGLTALLKKLFVGLAKSPASVLRRVFEPLTNPEKRKKFETMCEGIQVFWKMHLPNTQAYKNVDQWMQEAGYD